MTSTAAPTVKDQELVSSGLVESASVNSFADFIPSKLDTKEVFTEKEKNDFINTFICHLIFYAFFCISLVLYIVIDLGIGSLIKKAFIHFIDLIKNYFIEKNPVFA
tara:strand:+ start:353 stop:670 length:318 start_codon:yes stop_codon:yes gene_type:complete